MQAGFTLVCHTGVVPEKHFIITDKYASLTGEEATENHKISLTVNRLPYSSI